MSDNPFLPPQAEERLEALGTDLETYLANLVNDYVFFVEEIWHDRALYQFAPIGDVERDMCRFAANQEGLYPNRRVIYAPRGVGKTHLITASLATWDQFTRPGEAYNVIVSKSDREAAKTITLIRQWIDHIWFLQHLRPDQKKDHRDAARQFDIGPATKGRNPSVSTYGIEGQIEGVRASRLIPDDVETKGNTKTQDAREELDSRVKEFTAIASYEPRDICYVGTFHHEETLYLKLAKRGYLLRTYPELYPRPDEKVCNLAPILQKRLDSGEAKPGDIVFSHRRDEQYILERQAEGKTYFAMQHMGIANLGDALRYPLRLSDFIVYPVNRDRAPISIAWGTSNHTGGTRCTDIESLGFSGDYFYGPIMVDEAWAPYTGTKMRIDPSGKGTDHTGYAIVAQLNGNLWVKAVGGLPGGYSPETLIQLAQAAKQHKAGEIIVESNFGQDMFVALFEPVLRRHFIEPGEDPAFPDGWKCAITSKATRGQKESRIIDALEPGLAQHRIILDPAVARNERLQRQITRITRQPNSLKEYGDDDLEALAMCIADWRLDLSVDPEKAAERERDRAIDEALAEQRRAMGLGSTSKTWAPKW